VNVQGTCIVCVCAFIRCLRAVAARFPDVVTCLFLVRFTCQQVDFVVFNRRRAFVVFSRRRDFVGFNRRRDLLINAVQLRAPAIEEQRRPQVVRHGDDSQTTDGPGHVQRLIIGHGLYIVFRTI